MAEQFIDTVAEHITGAMQQEIGEELFDQWSANNLDEGEAYAEFMFMRFASDELKQQYNEYYGYIEGDEFLL
jgi:GGDEF domain-containing protein